MSKIISVNAGSSSLKFQLFSMPEETVLTSGIAERIGQEEGVFTIKIDGKKETQKLPIPDHAVAVDLLMKALIKFNVVESLDEISAAGHRVVQGGSYFDQSVKVDEDVVAKVDEMCELAPLHNPAHLICYKAFKEALPKIEHVFVFDTAFHQTMEPKNYLFPVPYSWYEDYKIRRYGAHGTSHQFVSQRTAELIGKDVKDVNIITCHLGNGASITAVKGGKCINTSMGLTPLGGVMMGTRSGDLDPSVVLHMMKKLNITAQEMDTILNKQSGMLGVSGISSDARDIDDAAMAGDERGIRTQELYTTRVADYLGAYFVEMGHVDAIAFTAGLGENDSNIREQVIKKVEEAMRIDVDYDLNRGCREEKRISTDKSDVEVWIVPTNEELVIAKDTQRILGL